jgi:hypothetical protein
MKSICKKGTVTLVAVLALCAVASASASAAQWYVGGKALVGSATLSQTTKVEEKIKITSEGIEITCSTLTAGETRTPFEIVAPATLKVGDLLLKGCTVTVGNQKCGLGGGSGEEIGTRPLIATLSLGTGLEDHGELVRNAKEGESIVWTEFEVGGCGIEGFQFRIKGKVPVKLPHGQTSSTEQELVFEKAAGLYNFSEGNPVYLTGKVKLKLTSGSTWGLH